MRSVECPKVVVGGGTAGVLNNICAVIEGRSLDVRALSAVVIHEVVVTARTGSVQRPEVISAAGTAGVLNDMRTVGKRCSLDIRALSTVVVHQVVVAAHT